MHDARTRERLHRSLSELVEAAGAVMGKSSLVYAAGLRALTTRTPDDTQQFFRHLDHLNEADQICIAQRRTMVRYEHWSM
ncbi:hypothetical protein [Rhodospirillaceae bacterium SYSU D60014]|uniref:hypothetical protein n=1 Tax=Virgifigura deserti TaxID=2268457 RepID=UPI000E661446